VRNVTRKVDALGERAQGRAGEAKTLRARRSRCVLGPVPAVGALETARPEREPWQRFEDTLAMVAPIALAMLLTQWLGIETPAFLEQWVREAVAFLESDPAG
jgi:hypothetical protein